MDNFTSLLQAVQSGDPNVRGPAEQQLLELEENRFPEYFGALVNELVSENKPDGTRMAAALQIKRTLTGQDDTSQRRKLEQWQTKLDDNMRRAVKEACVRVLATAPPVVANQAAQSIEAVARVELASDSGWPELPDLLAHAFDEVHRRDPTQVTGPLKALGYYANEAEKTDFDPEPSQINKLLSKISMGMSLEMPAAVQVAATEALENTLAFAKHNMDNEVERRVIMGLIIKMTESAHSEARVAAFQCLAQVLGLYYHYLGAHMEEIWQRTTAAIQNSANDEDSAKSALNFWDELAYEESERLATMRESGGQIAPVEQSQNFIPQVRELLVKLVLEYCMLQQDETPDDEERTEDTLYGSAEHCFVSLSACLGDAILQQTFAFVQVNMNHADWRRRQAAIFAFGSVLRDNSSEALAEAVNAVFPQVLLRVNEQPPSPEMNQNLEPVATVRETAAWAVAQVCQGHLSILNPANMQPMILSLLQALRDKPRVAHMGATAIHCFASEFSHASNEESNMLSGNLFQRLASALWDAARRVDSSEWQLMEDAFEALIKLIEVSARDMQGIVGGVLLGHALLRLEEIRNGSVRDDTGYQEVELCDMVIACVLKLDVNIRNYQLPNMQGGNDPNALPDKIVETMIHVLRKPGSNAHPSAFLAIAEIARISGPGFQRYDPVMPLVYDGLASRTNSQTCIACVRLCADICSALEGAILPLVPRIMELVYNNLKAEELQREVKPPHLTVMGDIAAAIGHENFRPYFANAVTTALSAADYPVDIMDDENADYLNELRASALEAMEMMFLDAQAADLQPFLSHIFQLANLISLEVSDPRNYYSNKDPVMIPPDLENERPPYSVSESVMKAMLGVLGDVASKMGDTFTKPIREAASFGALFNAGRNSDNDDLREAAIYAASRIGI